MLNAAAINAYLYAKNGGKKPTINLKKEGEKLFLIGICAALAFTAWFYIPALSSVLLYFLVPLMFYFLYNIYNFSKNCLHKLLNKDNKTHDENREAINVIAMDQPSQTVRIIESQKQIESLSDNIPEYVKAYLKGLAIQNPQKTFELADIVKKIDLIFNNLSQPTNDRFYKSLMNLILVDHEKANALATWIRDNDALLNRVKQCTESEHYEYVTNLSFANREKAHALATLIDKVNNLFNEISQPTRNRFYKYVMNLTLTDHDKAYSLATWIRDNDALLNRVKQCTKSEHYKCVIDLSFTNREKAHALATLIDEVNNQFNKIRQSTRDKFFDPIIELAYTNRDDALVLATVVKEIDGIVSGITNKDLLDYFDQFFTFTETQHVHERTKAIEFARACKRIHDVMPINLQKISAVQAKLRPEGILPGGIIIAYFIIVRTNHMKAESTARRKDSNNGMFFLALFFIANQ